MNTHDRHLSHRLDATITGLERGRVSRLVYRLLRLRKRLIEAAVFGGCKMSNMQNPPISLAGYDIQSIRNYCFNIGKQTTRKLNEVARYDLPDGVIVIIYKHSAVVAGTNIERINEIANDIREAIETRNGRAACRHVQVYGCAPCEHWICENCGIGHAPDCEDMRGAK